MEFLAVCHVHSKWSYDGSWTLEALAERFSRRGFRVLMMTEHDRGFSAARLDEYREACARASSEKILVVPGIEYSDASNRVHVLVWGRVPFLGEGLPTGEMLDGVRNADGVAVLAHPSRRDAWKSFEPSWGERLLGIEIWNRKYDGWNPSKTAPELLASTKAIPFVGLDFHTVRQSFPLGMALDLRSEITEEAVLESLKSRRCKAKAFGYLMNGSVIRGAVPVLGMAETGRRMAASLIRRARVRKR
jgi:hypothetical protein